MISVVPQGEILSPMIFTIYEAVMQEWVKSSKIFNYNYDITSDTKRKKMEIVIKNLESNTNIIL